MSKYYKAEDIEREIERLLRFVDSKKDFGFGVKYGIETVERVLKDLPTIEVSEDAISREWVLEEFQKGKEKISKLECFVELMWLVKHAPSVIPKPKEGEWIEKYYKGVDIAMCECSICHNHHERANYCPNCGAKMEGVDNER